MAPVQSLSSLVGEQSLYMLYDPNHSEVDIPIHGLVAEPEAIISATIIVARTYHVIVH